MKLNRKRAPGTAAARPDLEPAKSDLWLLILIAAVNILALFAAGVLGG